MIRIVNGLLAIIALVLITSCSSNNQVVSNGCLQKRKHTTGFYFAGFKSKVKTEQKLKSELDLTCLEVIETAKQELTIDKPQTKVGIIEKSVSVPNAIQPKNNEPMPGGLVNISSIENLHSKDISIPKSELKNVRKRVNLVDGEDSLSANATISFFLSILGWVLLVAMIPTFILGFWQIGLIFEAVAYFLSDSADNIKSGEIAQKLSSYYWYFMATVLTVSLGSIVFYF